MNLSHHLIVIIIVISIGLSACAAPTLPVPAPTTTTQLPTETPAPVLTKTLVPTTTPEAVATPENVVGDIALQNLETIELSEYKGIKPATIQIATDKHLLDSNKFVSIQQIISNPDTSFRTRYNEMASESIVHVAYYSLFQRAKNKGFSGDFNSFMRNIVDVQNGRGDPTYAEISVIHPDASEHFFNAADSTKKINFTFHNHLKNPQYSVNIKSTPFRGGSIVDSEGNLNFYIGDYPYEAAWIGGQVISSNAAMSISLELEMFAHGYHGGTIPIRIVPIERYKFETFRILTNEISAPAGYSELFPDRMPWKPSNWYTSAIIIVPNDELELFSGP